MFVNFCATLYNVRKIHPTIFDMNTKIGEYDKILKIRCHLFSTNSKFKVIIFNNPYKFITIIACMAYSFIYKKNNNNLKNCI